MENAILTKYLYFLKTVQLRLLLLGISRNLLMSKSQRSMRLSIQRKIRAKFYHPRLVPEIESWSLNWQFTSNFIPTSMLKESDPSITKTNSNGGGTFLRIIIFCIPKSLLGVLKINKVSKSMIKQIRMWMKHGTRTNPNKL